MARRAHGAAIPSPYGAIFPQADQNTGLNLIQLPEDFKYWSFGWTGDPLTDGNVTPALHDGMAVAIESRRSGEDWYAEAADDPDRGRDDDDDDDRDRDRDRKRDDDRDRDDDRHGRGRKGRSILLIRNHEVGNGPSFAAGPIQYSPEAGGGNVNLIWDTRTKKVAASWASLSGTIRNCAGGVTPWNSWISCEETGLTTVTGGTFKHGYCFDVPAFGTTSYNSTPVPEMGRFAHEAVCVDPETSIVYQTEDGPTVPGEAGSGFFRYVPRRYGRLHRGGKLQMLKIRGEPNKDLQFLGASSTVWRTEWVDIAVPDPNIPPAGTDKSCFQQGFDEGGAIFRRLEGCWFDTDEDKVYFLSTSGGPNATGSTVGEGQVFVYDPKRERLRIIFHSEDVADCENPDNLVVTPRGALLLCEDNASPPNPSPNAGERLLGLTLEGGIFTFAQNNLDFTASGLGPYTRLESGITYDTDLRQNEWAGACFDRRGDWMFVNIQTPGITFAITGPWKKGPF
jgi:secreted PhoX family phosphatase